MTTEQVHISQIKTGDTVIIDGIERTVNASDIKRDPFMGHTLFGDSHRMGTLPITRVVYRKVH